MPDHTTPTSGPVESRECAAHPADPALSAGDGFSVFEWNLATDGLVGSPTFSTLLAEATGSVPSTGQSLLALLQPADRDRLLALNRSLAPARPSYRAQWWLARPGREATLVELRGWAVFNAAGQPLRLIGTIDRVESTPRLAAALPDGESLYRAIGESIDYGVWMCAPDGRNLYASDSFLAMVGITQEQCSDFGWGSVLHPDDADRTIAAWKECVRTGSTWDIEHRFRGVDGEWHDILARGVPVHNRQGEVVCWAGINLDISRLKRTEKALREVEEFNSAILDSVSAQVAVLDRTGTIIAVNRPWREFALDNSSTPGSPPPHTDVGTNYLDVCQRATGSSAEGAATVRVGVQEVLDGTAEKFSLEYPCHAPDRRRWFLLTATAFGGSHGGAVVSHTDITEPMLLSEDLQRAHERLALAQQCAGAGVWDWTVGTGVLEWSEELYRLFGLEAARTRPSFEAWRSVVHPDDRVVAEGRITDAMQRGETLDSIYRVVLPSGEVRWIQALGKTTYDTNGQAVRMSGICLDVTQRKRAEEELFATNQRLQSLMKALPVGVSFSADASCRHLTGNPALLAQFEMVAEDELSASAADPRAAGRRVRYLREGREVDPAELPLQRAATEGQPIEPAEFEVTLPSGRRWYAEISGAPIRDAQGTVMGGVAVVVDVTQRRKAEEALRDADRRKDEFLAMLAHELRNPLTPIRNAVYIMGKVALPDARLKWAQEVVEEQVTQLARLVDDLLDVSRIVRGKIRLQRERVQLEPLLQRAATAVRPTVEARRQLLAVRLPEQPTWVHADPVRLIQVVVNLLDNAAKFTPEGGHIELAARRSGTEVVIDVRDDGCGIAPDLLPHVFDLFQQGDVELDRTTGGLGIGLTLVHRLVALHGGRVDVVSPGPGQGATFTARLPASTPPAATPEAIHAHEAPDVGRRARVLVVDDDKAVVDSTRIWLEMAGFDVRSARSGLEALQEAADFRPQAVLLDIGLAGMDGYETARRLRALPEGKDFLLVAVTGYGHDEAVTRARASGFDRHVVKPFDPRALLTLLTSRLPNP